MHAAAPKLFVVMGPYGVGKSTIITSITNKINSITPLIPMTTRDKRPTEQEGVDYHFITVETFKTFLEDSEPFLQHIECYNHHYGSLMRDLKKIFLRGNHAIIALSDDALAQARKSCQRPIVTVFIKPPNQAALKNRLNQRGDPSSSVHKRLKAGIELLEGLDEAAYDHVIINDNLDSTVKNLTGIIFNIDNNDSLTILSEIFNKNDVSVVCAQWTQLGGWSNQNFRASIDFSSGGKRNYFVKKMLPYSSAYQNREEEIKNLKALRDFPSCPKLIATGLVACWQIFAYLDGYKPLSPSEFTDDSMVQKSVANALASLHQFTAFYNSLNVFERTRTVFEYLESKGVEQPKKILSLILLLKQSLKTDLVKKPCHNDTTPTNFLLGPDKNIKMVDFENSGNNDPAWDLAFLSVEVEMTQEQEAKLVKDYLGHSDEQVHNKVIIFKLVVMHWISLWTKLQSFESNPSQPQTVFETKSSDSLMAASFFAKSRSFKEAWSATCHPSSENEMQKLVAHL